MLQKRSKKPQLDDTRLLLLLLQPGKKKPRGLLNGTFAVLAVAIEDHKEQKAINNALKARLVEDQQKMKFHLAEEQLKLKKLQVEEQLKIKKEHHQMMMQQMAMMQQQQQQNQQLSKRMIMLMDAMAKKDADK
jgi:hypothetical protein